jgi:23S rRNA pseudouridine2605 synthase
MMNRKENQGQRPDRKKKATDKGPSTGRKTETGKPERRERREESPAKTPSAGRKTETAKPERRERREESPAKTPSRGKKPVEDRAARTKYKKRTPNPFGRSKGQPAAASVPKDGLVRLNKYLADSGVCSRREADELIKAGVVKVNGVIVSEVGTKVSIHDKVMYGGQTLSRETLRYVLLNKPKDYITTSDDPFNRKTVMELVAKACTERIYPVGRLDRNTLGLLLFTNDGELAKRLMHPRHKVKKLYHVELDKPLSKGDMMKIVEGVELEDGKAEVDKVAWVETAESKREVGLELHSGKNRIVRRIFEHLGYNVIRLDRVMLAGLTKLNLPRGRYRHLTTKEITMLKMIK